MLNELLIPVRLVSLFPLQGSYVLALPLGCGCSALFQPRHLAAMMLKVDCSMGIEVFTYTVVS